MSNKWCDDEIYLGKMRRSKNRMPRRISAKRSEPPHLMTANSDRTRSLLVVCRLWFLLDFASSHRQKKTKENKRACTWNLSYNEIFINAFRNCEGSSLISSSNISVFTGQHYKTQLFQTLAKTKHRTESNWKLRRTLQLLALLWVSCAINSLSNIKPNQDLNVWPLSNWF